MRKGTIAFLRGPPALPALGEIFYSELKLWAFGTEWGHRAMDGTSRICDNGCVECRPLSAREVRLGMCRTSALTACSRVFPRGST